MATGTIVGKGLYLEFVPADKTSTRVLQVLFTPEGYDEKGNFAQFSLHSRTVSEHSPRKQWRITRCGMDNKTALTSGAPLAPERVQELGTVMVERFQRSILKAVFPRTGDSTPEWVLRSKPIAIEITSFDLLEVNEWKTPAPALRRIQKCRVALDFPEKLV